MLGGISIPLSITNSVFIATWLADDPIPKSHSERSLPGTPSGNLLFESQSNVGP